jgi:hypothetical protein
VTPLSGDPTVFGNLLPDDVVKAAVVDVVNGNKHNGYAPSIGKYFMVAVLPFYSLCTYFAPMTLKAMKKPGRLWLIITPCLLLLSPLR